MLLSMGSQRVGYNLATKPPRWPFCFTFPLSPPLCWSSRALACHFLRWLAIWIKSLFLASTVHLPIIALSCDEQTELGCGNAGLSPLTCENASALNKVDSASRLPPFWCDTILVGARQPLALPTVSVPAQHPPLRAVSEPPLRDMDVHVLPQFSSSQECFSFPFFNT